MAPSPWLLLLLLASASSGTVNNCHPGCHCDVESFGLFDSFSLTRVDCQGLGPGIAMPVAIPLDTTHLDLSFNAMHGPLTSTMLAGPGYTTLTSLDLSNNHITKVSGVFFLMGNYAKCHRGNIYRIFWTVSRNFNGFFSSLRPSGGVKKAKKKVKQRRR